VNLQYSKNGHRFEQVRRGLVFAELLGMWPYPSRRQTELYDMLQTNPRNEKATKRYKGKTLAMEGYITEASHFLRDRVKSRISLNSMQKSSLWEKGIQAVCSYV
jgi:hypothetical protein